MKNFDSQMTRILFMAVSAMLVATPGRTQNSLSERFEFKPGGEGAYEPREFSFDLAGFYATRNKGGQPEDAGGLAGGVSYFFLRNWGVGVDTYADAFEAPYLLNASGIFRYPVTGTGLGPYGFGGFGRQWEHAAQWQGHLGAGL